MELRGLAPKLADMVAAYDPKDFVQPPRGRSRVGIFEHIGRATAEQIAYVRVMFFVGDCVAMPLSFAIRVSISR